MWKVEYFLMKTGDVVDPEVLTKLSQTHINTEIQGLKSPQGGTYSLTVSSKASLVDYRQHFQLLLNTEVRNKDLRQFEDVVSDYWKAKHGQLIVFKTVHF